MAGMFDDFLSYLMGGTQLGNMLGVGSPTAATQTPTIVPSGTAPTGVPGPVLGGAPAPASAGGGGLLSGLLGGQAPVNPMSYFQPQQGLLGNSPLANMLGGAFGGLASVQPGQRGLAALGAGAMGGQQAVQDRRQNMMRTALAGQQYQAGQQGLISGAIANQSALLHINNIREYMGLPDVTMADITANPDLVSNPTQGQPPAPGSAAATGQPAPAQSSAPIAPTMTQTDPHVTQAQGTIAGPPPQTAVATQFPNQHGIIVPMTAPPTATLPSTTNVQPQSAATASQPAIPMTNGTTSAPPVTTAPPPTQQGAAGGFPQTQAAIEASNLPAWAKSELHAAHMTGDYGEIAKAEADVGKYLGAPQQAAATKTAEAAAGYGTQETINKTAGDIRQTLTTDPAYKIYHETKPAADAFRTALNARGTSDYTGDYDLVLSALKVMNPDAAQPRQGTIISATDLPTMPAKLSKAILALWNDDTALPGDIPDQLANAVQSHMKINQNNYDNLLGNIKVRAKSELPPGYNLRNLDPNAPPPPPPRILAADGKTVLVPRPGAGTYDPTKDDGSPGSGWTVGKNDWVPE